MEANWLSVEAIKSPPVNPLLTAADTTGLNLSPARQFVFASSSSSSSLGLIFYKNGEEQDNFDSDDDDDEDDDD